MCTKRIYKIKAFSVFLLLIATTMLFFSPLVKAEAIMVVPSNPAENLCQYIEAANVNLRLGSGRNIILDLNERLYEEQDQEKSLFFYEDKDMKTYIDDNTQFFGFNTTLSTEHVNGLFIRSVENPTLSLDYPGARPNINVNIINLNTFGIPLALNLSLSTDNVSESMRDSQYTYEFATPDSVNPIRDKAVQILKGNFTKTGENQYFQLLESYTYNETTKLTCGLRFNVIPPVPETPATITLRNNENNENNESIEAKAYNGGYYFNIASNTNYTLQFSDIQKNTLKEKRETKFRTTTITYLTLKDVLKKDPIDTCSYIYTMNSATGNIRYTEECNIFNNEVGTWSTQIGPGGYRFDKGTFTLNLVDGENLLQALPITFNVDYTDIPVDIDGVVANEPDNEFSEDLLQDMKDQRAGKKTDAALILANTIDLCETIPETAMCGKIDGQLVKCKQKCTTCIPQMTTAELSELRRLQAIKENQLTTPQQTQLATLQQKSNGLSSTHVWTGLGCFPTDISGLISTVFTTLVGVLGGFILLCIIFEGMRIMTSAGNPEALKKAQEGITSCIIGFIVVFFSVLILRIIGVDILQLPWFGPK